ncbi:hypothetical protein ORI20_20695 [Mycobacterium sp. CVI_P3]|uniref:Lipoprotein n=1 Tax=Mycobacterium pinniadriaticum TaxID=2994102 RepID=A0ABT3SHX8_9MYCO|nr:hypothetical protein [Mycobacterium pinniadriaticum]MCX2932695.1 hypothetical protein [Mycobacterium pinniadriaticum]MCX2939119.1 hypothetical protein [Mycobacterium pinniadriaticum]
MAITARGAQVVGAVLAAVVVSGLGGCTSAPVSGTLSSPFASSSPWRQVIPADASVDPDSAVMIAAVQPRPGLFANLVEFGIPIYGADKYTPTHEVSCIEVNYGVCPFAGWPVAIPDDAKPNSGSDGALVTVDESSGVVFEFWRAAKKGETWSTAFAAVNSLHGSGWGGAATGSGASRLAGVVRIAEIAKGEIPHALALQSDNACTTFRPPALKSDGHSTRDDCIPEGALLQLDPSLDLNALNLTPGERAVATAMQRYGGYLMDVAATPLSVSFELDRDAAPGTVGKTYADAGFRWDYDAMEHVPWDKLRVLK